jgi:hypothetical protein
MTGSLGFSGLRLKDIRLIALVLKAGSIIATATKRWQKD